MLRKVVFDYAVGGEIFFVEARVMLGSTCARGDHPDEVVSIKIEDQDYKPVPVDSLLYQVLVELAIIEAKEQECV